MRQNKGRGVTILDPKNYIKKCVSILDTSQFRKLDNDPNESYEMSPTANTTKNNKKKFEENECKKLYPIGSILRLFYGTPKVHNLQQQ